jgi:hypothetical protein
VSSTANEKHSGAERYGRRLAIIVPYRDRAQHLAKFIPHFCFHDVDYLPIWADYSWSEKPARLVWRGLRLRENKQEFFGAAVLFDKQAFERVNGYPNAYWGWGREDFELRLRCGLAGLEIEHRDGTFQPLHHKHRGFSVPGSPTDEALRTEAVFAQRKPKLAELMGTDGLTNLQYQVMRKGPIKFKGAVMPNMFHYLLDVEPHA